MTKLVEHVCLALAWCGLLLLPRAASAEPSADSREESSIVQPVSPTIERARAHFRRGVEFYRQGDFRLALIEFRRSYELSGHHDILYNIGQVNHQLNNYADALRALRRYLSQGGERVPEARRGEVRASISELERRVARIHFRVNVAGAELSIDDTPIGRVTREHTLIVDPGDHRVELFQRGYRPLRRGVTVTAGDTAQVTLILQRIPEAKTAFPRPAERSTSGWVYAGWITTSVFAVGAGVTGVLALMEADELADQRSSPGSTASERQATSDRARLFATTSDALTGAAVAAGLTSLYLTFSDSSSDEAHPRAGARLGFGAQGVTFSASY